MDTIQAMDQQHPRRDPTQAEMQSDDICTICREKLGVQERPLRTVCSNNHAFHMDCIDQ